MRRISIGDSSSTVKSFTPTIDPALLLELLLVPERGVRDLLLEEARLDRRDHAAKVLDLFEVPLRLALHLVGERLDEVAPTERVDRVRNATLDTRAAAACAARCARTLSVGSASTSSIALVCSDCVPPSTAASASIAVRAMFSSGCCAVSDTPAVCV